MWKIILWCIRCLIYLKTRKFPIFFLLLSETKFRSYFILDFLLKKSSKFHKRKRNPGVLCLNKELNIRWCFFVIFSSRFKNSVEPLVVPFRSVFQKWRRWRDLGIRGPLSLFSSLSAADFHFDVTLSGPSSVVKRKSLRAWTEPWSSSSRCAAGKGVPPGYATHVADGDLLPSRRLGRTCLQR